MTASNGAVIPVFFCKKVLDNRFNYGYTLLKLVIYTGTFNLNGGGEKLNKAELVAAIAKDAGVSKSAAEKALNSFTGNVTKVLKKGGRIALVGFGTFSVQKRAARNGRNPQTGASIKIPARKVVKFSAGKSLKTSVR